MARFKTSRSAWQRVRLHHAAFTAVVAALLLLAGRRSSAAPPPHAAAADQPPTVVVAAAGAAAGQVQHDGGTVDGTGDRSGGSSGSRVIGTYMDVGPDGDITRQLLEEPLPIVSAFCDPARDAVLAWSPAPADC